jgi:light-regulated signal transduction histidine kinase (bacteriophytochrome)
MARVGRTSNTLAALTRRVKALVRKTVEWLTARRVESRDAGRFEDVLHLLERDARLKAELLDELRRATRLGESAQVHLSSEIDLAELVRSTTESLAVVAHEQNITVRVRCAATSIVIVADPDDLTHVVARLLASAIAWSTRGSTVDCELSLSADWTRLVIRAAVGDDDLARIPRVLESPSRDPSDRDAAAWERLGLMTVRTSVQRQGGTVRLESHDCRLILTLSLPGDRAPSTAP